MRYNYSESRSDDKFCRENRFKTQKHLNDND